MTEKITSQNLLLQPQDNQRLSNLCGLLDENLRQIETYMSVEISNRGNSFIIKGDKQNVPLTSSLIEKLYLISAEEELTSKQLHMYMNNTSDGTQSTKDKIVSDPDDISIKCKKITIRPKSKSQQEYVKAIMDNDLTFGIGSAGTGKTYLAVACAIYFLEKDLVKKIFLVRPAIEAGEKLGFLPGDLSEKVNPYLQPIYDALDDVIGAERVNKLIEKKVIEIAPLAYMRGRTLNDAFIILDEGQNTTIAQMEMFLTRIGFGSKAVVTGDTSQIDLPRDSRSGLKDCLEFMPKINGAHITKFKPNDVMRHKIVKDIIKEYDRRKK
ncbi:MAG: PhoH family protein [Gammaproteobacteria bacterium]|nr:PhoH family protein [Gammaproteobacteria bacterium]MBT4462847.1 PhoH family protein [Gammaproteobacteria bacterium]MBT4655116.1 PhoH family protein [Gammaproteobacteria bacterium]MBT5116702.1 PhoH family protein [Gammaproteobacteria bacterium]MBT5761800.1 PhoH family protein [Gammaproteobacteria bacterium]